MSNETDVRTYFMEHAPQIPNITVRAMNAVVRGGILTMEELCAADERRIRRLRNLGDKGFAFVLEVREQYKEGLR